MEIIDFLYSFLKEEGREDLCASHADFFRPGNDVPEEAVLRALVLANMELKRKLAKYIVERVVNGGEYFEYYSGYKDVRLDCFIAYYFSKALLSPDIDSALVKDVVSRSGAYLEAEKSKYLSGITLRISGGNVPVCVCPGEGLHCGYKVFSINMLCFDCGRFMLGIRADSGPVAGMKYHKGCQPAGIRKDVSGREWTLIAVDSTLSDDYTAVFSNVLDGDGSLEICDWLSDQEQRVIFRSDF